MVIVEFLVVKFINTPHNASNANLHLLPRNGCSENGKSHPGLDPACHFTQELFPCIKLFFFSQALDQNICFVHVGVLKLIQNKLIFDTEFIQSFDRCMGKN